MKDIICTCGHGDDFHTEFECVAPVGNAICDCTKTRVGVLLAHIAKLEAVVEAAKAWRKGWPDGHARAVDALDSTDVP